jgi:hypothetical protein
MVTAGPNCGAACLRAALARSSSACTLALTRTGFMRHGASLVNTPGTQRTSHERGTSAHWGARWLLASGCWLLASGCWLLASGCWLLASGCWLLASAWT